MKANTLEAMESYGSLSDSVRHTPSVIHVGAVSGCPLSCAMCTLGSTKPQKMSKNILSKIEPYYENLEMMSITGSGEPLFADIDYFVEKSLENNFVLHMNTSAYYLTQSIADKLLKSNLSIRFSIHAGSNATYKKIMGKTLDRIKENIKYLTLSSKTKNKNDDFWFSYIVIKENIDEIEDFLAMAHVCGIKSIRFMHLLPNPQTKKGKMHNERNYFFKYSEQFNDQVVNTFKQRLSGYKKMADEFGIKIELGSMDYMKTRDYPIKDKLNGLSKRILKNYVFPIIRNKGTCVAPWLGQLRISQNGDVRLCCGTPFIVGNIENSTIFDIWNSTRLKRIRKSFGNGFLPKICGYCRGFSISNYPNNAFVGFERS